MPRRVGLVAVVLVVGLAGAAALTLGGGDDKADSTAETCRRLQESDNGYDEDDMSPEAMAAASRVLKPIADDASPSMAGVINDAREKLEAGDISGLLGAGLLLNGLCEAAGVPVD